jgi:hypothetical protein
MYKGKEEKRKEKKRDGIRKVGGKCAVKIRKGLTAYSSRQQT